ncbi:hypothetical protein [Acidocella sp.]|uniref:hypothetical protein n=1 Tax=Acidocella sp. TaxID=50710 RepID=UPI003D075CC7
MFDQTGSRFCRECRSASQGQDIIKAEADMNFHLVVLKPFGTFKRGDLIKDAATVQKILSGGNADSVVRVAAKGN